MNVRSYDWMRKWVLGLAVFLSVSSVCRALQFDAFIGYSGIVREVSWFPVTCEIMNDGPAFTGTIEISGTHLGTSQRRRLSLELPTNTRKRVFLPVFHAGGGLASWDARLYDETGKLRAEQPGVRLREVAWEGVLMGALSRTFAGAPKFPTFREENSTMQPVVGRITPEQFPDTAIALEGLSSFYLNSEQALKLASPQIAALTEWVVSGGHLVLAIEQPADVIASEWLHPLVPFVPESISQLDVGQTFFDWLANPSPDSLPPLTTSSDRIRSDSIAYEQIPRELEFENAQIPIVLGRVTDGEILMESGGVPLVVSSVRGRGVVTVFAFSPEREPFRSWKSKSWFWAKLNCVPFDWFDGPRFNTWGGSSVDGIFGSLIESRQVQKLPVKWLLLLLVVYLIVIGPFDHWILKKIDRQMLTWITFPAYVVIFSLMIYLIGYKLRSGVSEWSEFHMVDVMPGQNGASLRGRSYGAIYSPANRRYDLYCSVPGSTFRVEFHGMSGGGQDASESTIQHGDSGTSAQVFVPVWTSQLYVADWSTRSEMPFQVRATREGDEWSLELKNQAARRAASIGVLIEGQFYELEGLASGETRNDIVRKNHGERLTSFMQEHARGYQSILSARQQALGETIRLDDVSRHPMVASFLSRVGSFGRQSRGYLSPLGMDLAALGERGEVVVLVFYPDYSPINQLNQFDVLRGSKNTLMRISVTPDTTATGG